MNDSQISTAIRNIRAAAGAELGLEVDGLCPTCGRPADDPARRLGSLDLWPASDGEIVEGCVDAHHTGALPAGSATAAWHDRPEAQQLRARELASLPEPASVSECLALMGM